MTRSRLNLFLAAGISAALGWAGSAEGMAIQEQGVRIAPSDELPGNGFVWEGVGPHEQWPSFAIQEQGVKITALGGQSPTMTPTGWAIDSFFDIFYEIDFSVNGGPIQHVTGLGTGHMVGTAPPGEPRFFDTEMLSLNLSGNISMDPNAPPDLFLLRESPTRPSTGQTVVKNLGDGGYRINSFFDVFTELSLDGGQTWKRGIPSPEPTTLALAVLGGLTLLRRRR